MRTIAIALESYARDHQGQFPNVRELIVPANPDHKPTWTWPPSSWPLRPDTDVRLLRPRLEPGYVTELPIKDVWGRPIRCAIRADLTSYTLVSFGRDGREDTVHSVTSPRGELDRDLVLVDGDWLCFPEGTAM
jgi:hypothetical protein